VSKSHHRDGSCAEPNSTSALPGVGTIILLGGQDAPSEQKLRAIWGKVSARLPPHHLLVAQWRAAADAPVRSAGARRSPRRRAVLDLVDRACARIIGVLVGALDRSTRFDDRGRPTTSLTRLVHRFTRFSVAVLYDVDSIGTQLAQRVAGLVAQAPPGPVVVVGHSVGGTIAKMALWSLACAGSTRDVSLITLGTNCGSTLVRSPFFARLPRSSSRKITRPANLTRWLHVWSRRDRRRADPAQFL